MWGPQHQEWDSRLNTSTIHHALATLYFFCCMEVLTPALLPCPGIPPHCSGPSINLGVGGPTIPPAPEHTREGGQ